MNEIQDTIHALIPSNHKVSPSGWISCNGICCHHMGESADTRRRGGLLLNPNGGFQWHCFNCNFKAGWTPGHLLTKNAKNLFKWMGLADSEISKLNLYALKIKDDTPVTKSALNFSLNITKLPDNCKSIEEWIAEGNNSAEFLAIIEYILNRGMELDWYSWHWSTENGYKDRVIIPFYYDNNIVGYTGRKILPGKLKYLKDAQPGYVFNIDKQKNNNKKYVIVVEGQFDAIAIDGVAIMHNDPNETQAARINALGKQVIVVPDKDKAGAVLVGKALDYSWGVSLPDWGDDIKDVADAVKSFGRIFTLLSIINNIQTSSLKLQLLQKKLENLKDDKNR